jgi:hypothetical protein
VLTYAQALDGSAALLAGKIGTAPEDWHARWRRVFEAVPSSLASGPWNARAIWSQLEAWHRAIGRALRSSSSSSSSGSTIVGQVPHESDLWISTDDALDYAEHLQQKVVNVQQSIAEWTARDPAAADAWARAREWDRWLGLWLAYLEDLRSSWLARVNSWETIQARHFELVGLASMAEGAGMRKTDAGVPARDPLAQAGAALGGAAGTLADILKPLALIAAAVAAVVLLRR